MKFVFSQSKRLHNIILCIWVQSRYAVNYQLYGQHNVHLIVFSAVAKIDNE